MRKWMLAIGLFLLCFGAVMVIDSLRSKSSEVKDLRQVGRNYNLPLYVIGKSEKYHYLESRESQGIVSVSYSAPKGSISITQQVKPSSDPFPPEQSIESYQTKIGKARLFPDDQQNPYIVIETTFSWVIIRSSSTNITSADLKDFSISLKDINDL